MRYKHLVIFIFFSFMAGCNIVDLEEPTTPDVKVSPSNIYIDQEVEIQIKSYKEFILPFCGGINFTIQKKIGDDWELEYGQFGPCNTFFRPQTIINKSTSIYYTFTEAGIYRFASRYKSNPDDDWETFSSYEFEVESTE